MARHFSFGLFAWAVACGLIELPSAAAQPPPDATRDGIASHGRAVSVPVPVPTLGWQASLAGSCALCRWADLRLAFEAIDVRGEDGSLGGAPGTHHSINLTAYGPETSVVFRF